MSREMKNPQFWIGKRIPKDISFEHLSDCYGICDECGGFYPENELAGFLYPVNEADFDLLDTLGIDEALTFCLGCREVLEIRAGLKQAEAD